MKKIEQTIHDSHLPSNHIPILNRMLEVSKEQPFGTVDTPEFQACIHLLLMISHGQMYQIDAFRNHSKLCSLIKPYNQ